MQRVDRTPGVPGTQRSQGQGNPRKNPGEPRLGVASVIWSLSQTKGGMRVEQVWRKEEGEVKIQAEGRMRKDSDRGGGRDEERKKGEEGGGIA